MDQVDDKRSYRVRNNDTLSGIALRLYGNAHLWSLIAKKNGPRAPFLIFEGMKLRIPDIETASRSHALGVHGHELGLHGHEAGGHHNNALSHPPPPAGTHHVNSDRFEEFYATISRKPAAPVKFPAIKIIFKRDLPPRLTANAIVTATCSGELTLQQKGALIGFDFEFGKDGLSKLLASVKAGDTQVEFDGKDEKSLKIKAHYESKFTDLIGDAHVDWNRATNRASLKCKLTIAAKVNNEVAWSAYMHTLTAQRNEMLVRAAGGQRVVRRFRLCREDRIRGGDSQVG